MSQLVTVTGQILQIAQLVGGRLEYRRQGRKILCQLSGEDHPTKAPRIIGIGHMIALVLGTHEKGLSCMDMIHRAAHMDLALAGVNIVQQMAIFVEHLVTRAGDRR